MHMKCTVIFYYLNSAAWVYFLAFVELIKLLSD